MNTIRIEVEVPADLGVEQDPGQHYVRLATGTPRRQVHSFDPHSSQLKDVVWQQIAAAVEARKRRPPKFAVGDVVEWELQYVGPCAGVVRRFQMSPHGYLYWCNADDDYPIVETDLTLVRRAAK